MFSHKHYIFIKLNALCFLVLACAPVLCSERSPTSKLYIYHSHMFYSSVFIVLYSI